jgi:hypothetical protein
VHHHACRLLVSPDLQYVVVDLPGVPALLLRVTAANTLTAEEQQEVLGYHCFRWGGQPLQCRHYDIMHRIIQQLWWI